MALFVPKRAASRERVRQAFAFVWSAAAMLCVAAPLWSADGASGNALDAVTSASVDATTGASKPLEAVQVSGDFSVAYAVNDDGALFILAPDLADAYRRDELASDSLFKGHVLVVKGEIEKTSKPDAGKPWLTLVGDAGSGKKVRCSLKGGQLLGKSLASGDKVQVRGVCDGMKLSVSLSDGEIIG